MDAITDIADIISKPDFAPNEIGLTGKMGMSIFLFHYARLKNDQSKRKIAGDLLEEVVSHCDTIRSCKFYPGITGIGWGIELLSHQNYLQVNTDDILEEIDHVLLNANFQRLSIHTDDHLFEYGIYFLKRAQTESVISLKKKQILIFLIEEIENTLFTGNYDQHKIPVLNLQLLNSILYFLSEAYRIDIYSKKKLRNIILCLMEYISASLQKRSNPFSDCSITACLLEKYQSIIYNNDSGFTQLYNEINCILVNLRKYIKFDTKDYSVFAWNPLMYDVHPLTQDYITFLFSCPNEERISQKDLIHIGLIRLQIEKENGYYRSCNYQLETLM